MTGTLKPAPPATWCGSAWGTPEGHPLGIFYHWYNFPDDWTFTGREPVPGSDRGVEKSLRHNEFTAGKILAQINEEGLYLPKHHSFGDYVRGVLRRSLDWAYKVMFAYKVSVVLKEAGCPEPLNERHLRPLSRLKVVDRDSVDEKVPAERQVLAWTRACALKEEGSLPTQSEVQREVARILNFKPDLEADRKYKVFVRHLRNTIKFYLRARLMLLEGQMESFLNATDKPTKKRQRKILRAYARLIEILELDVATMTLTVEEQPDGDEPDEEEPDEEGKGEYDAFDL